MYDQLQHAFQSHLSSNMSGFLKHHFWGLEEISRQKGNSLKNRPDRQGAGCVIYYHKSLKTIHWLDLDDEQVEGICMQVKADSRDILVGTILVGTIYWPTNQNNEFFSAFQKLIENIWIKFSNIILLGDFNTNLLRNKCGDRSYKGNKMKGILEQFNNYEEGGKRTNKNYYLS